LKIDLHVHSSERSECGTVGEEEQIRAAISSGLDGIAFSDHDRLMPLPRLKALNLKFAPFKIFCSIEVNIRFSHGMEHILVVGIHDLVLESGDWSYPDLFRFVNSRQGFLALAHPFRFSSSIAVDIEHFPPDAIEVYSPNTPAWAEDRIRSTAARIGCYLLSNSDAHTTARIGKYYNDVEGSVSGESELIDLLKAGKFQPTQQGFPLHAVHLANMDR
jgi:predicted metal-dependent phosphoesterase TrpH